MDTVVLFDITKASRETLNITLNFALSFTLDIELSASLAVL